MEVSIHAVSPESSFGAAGACAAAGSVSTSIDVASISRCKTRYTDFINFLQETDKRGNEPSPDPWPDALPWDTKNRANRPLDPQFSHASPATGRPPIVRARRKG